MLVGCTFNQTIGKAMQSAFPLGILSRLQDAIWLCKRARYYLWNISEVTIFFQEFLSDKKPDGSGILEEFEKEK